MKKKALNELVEKLEHEINKTKSGELRNLLCDANVAVRMLALGDEEPEFTEVELYFMKHSINHFKEELMRVNEFYISTITDLGRIGAIEILEKIHEKLIL